MSAGIRGWTFSSFLRLVSQLRFLKFLFSVGLVERRLPALFALDKQRAKEPTSWKGRGLIAKDFRRSFLGRRGELEIGGIRRRRVQEFNTLYLSDVGYFGFEEFRVSRKEYTL